MLRTLLTCLLFLIPVTASAVNDKELYDPAPPADSAFVRLVNGGTAKIGGVIGNIQFKNVSAPGASPYSLLKEGVYDLVVNGKKTRITIKSGGYYSFAVAGDGSVITINDPLIKNPAKAMIYFYNLSDAKEASLRAPSHNTDIIGKQTSGSGSAKEINALTLDIAITANNIDVARYANTGLKRRTGYSFILSGSGAELKGAMVENGVSKAK